LVRQKHEDTFIWGDKQRRAFEKIKEYLKYPPVLQALGAGRGFKLYVVAQEKVVGAVLTQEDEGKEFAVTYLSQRLLDAQTR
jgi:hypothetical protein